MISYEKFWEKLASIDEVELDGQKIKFNLSRLIEFTGINTSVFHSMRNGEGNRKGKISMDTIERLCDFFDCQPCDLMEYVSE